MHNQISRWSDVKIPLNEIVPLKSPFTLNLEVSSLCNLKCKYCTHGSTNENLTKYRGIMNDEVFSSLCDSLESIYVKPHNIRLVGLGEPLVNKKCPEYISKLKQYADEVTVVSNGILLNNELSEKLVQSGLDSIKISLQGLDAQTYEEITGSPIDIKKFIDNITYFYSIRGNTKLFLKMPDIALTSPEMVEKSKDIFENICDGLIFETISPTYRDVDYSKIDLKLTTTVEGDELLTTKICPQPFYQLTINPNGTVSACNCDSTSAMIVGDILQNSINEIWVGDEINKLRKEMLHENYEQYKYCEHCPYIRYVMPLSDNIDSVSEKLLAYYK